MTRKGAYKELKRLERMLVDQTLQVLTVDNDWDDMETVSLGVCELASILNDTIREFAKIETRREWDD